MNEILINNSSPGDYAREGWDLRVADSNPITVELTDGTTEIHAGKWWLRLNAPTDGTPQQSFREERGRQRYVTGSSGELIIIQNTDEEHSTRDAELWRDSTESRVKTYAPGSWRSVSGGSQPAGAAGPFSPAAEWYAILRSVPGKTDPQTSRCYTPVLGWQQIESEGAEVMVAWILDRTPVRSDLFEKVVTNYQIAAYTRVIPEGAAAWNQG